MNNTYYGTLIFELSKPGRKGYSLPKNELSDYSIAQLPENLLRQEAPALPEVDELTVVRHYTNMSNNNFGVDTGFYPLGSCTMKYNPKINEEMAAHPQFTALHPLQNVETVQGALSAYYQLQRSLSEIAGMAEFTLNPFAGAHGELTGLMVIRRYHESRGDAKRTKIIVPDSAHGTNPASAAVCGLDVVEVKSKPDGRVDVEDLKPLLDDTIAGMMMTNPNTLGLFENNIAEIAKLVHDCGGLMYYDGANLNPMLGKCRPGDIGFDVMHINLHKTFSTPHGGGGPGSGPIGVREGLEQFLPNPRVTCEFDEDGMVDYKIEMGEESLGCISGFLGNFGVMMRALAYIVTLGSDNLKWVGPLATLNANYIKESLKDCYELPIEGVCKHEFVFDGLKDKSTGVTTLDVAKRLLDYGYHAPTIYFPLLFHQALMIEPTESESKETLDGFIAVMRKIAQEAVENPELVKTAPHSTPVHRLDDTKAALKQIVTWNELCETKDL
ncbi:MAG: aminomethyl-transferring glycine dehydrogenase subunit GcvPB [Sodaliphilus sp.]|jgi:glycine dehydrogenase subunit 2|nr:aminomethyl-transferring glycine dehydrogenase subunit GcvPB [Bacteroidales bacterium]MDY2673537.1 aminomethyl-transferring glycine dehydrogenase subunit GcvPB [Sodaliphilus sp.]MDD7052983.1 aminomethyl-transferring glycine dehydrogenase subunit GcvPB [Bacteroidales bacterium]MDD7190997.1 aminomethyl-transferring glycine dehydrogenase subunit GcvPB [Bacteroidales bacterium]MDD7500091.1 aminomethyl-transferring glycine dehydrogenase subunit GcvPB [Bacteroidales bacterium]